MMKRKRADIENEEQAKPLASQKRSRYLGRNCIDDLSDELVLRILSYLPLLELLKAELLCTRLKRLARDNEIWREKFYNDYVRPRARRIPKSIGLSYGSLSTHYASRTAKWLEHSAKFHKENDWKRRYKIKLNWSKGWCRAYELELDCPARPPVLVKVHKGLIFTATERCLRLYSQRTKPQIIHTHHLAHPVRQPTALSVSSRDADTLVTVGFNNGNVDIYTVGNSHSFVLESTHILSSRGAISALANKWPYVLSMSEQSTIELYRIHVSEKDTVRSSSATSLMRLQSNMPVVPVSLSLHKTDSILIASVAYPFSRLNAGWCLGIQEIRVNLAGDIIGSRLSSTINTPLIDSPFRKPPRVSSRSATSVTFPLHPQLMHPPNSLSHAGCYVLAGLPDNTLMVYTITSNNESLEINAGRRLWGHTSSIAGTEVCDRGKALSISAKGDEIRVWELEDILSSYSLRKTSTELKPRRSSDGIAAALNQRGSGVGLALQDLKHELPWKRNWIGFDDEQVVVLSEHNQNQVLSCYDFA